MILSILMLTDFNSMKVRLIQGVYISNSVAQRYFNSMKVRLIHLEYLKDSIALRYFNSMKVRLILFNIINQKRNSVISIP